MYSGEFSTKECSVTAMDETIRACEGRGEVKVLIGDRFALCIEWLSSQQGNRVTRQPTSGGKDGVHRYPRGQVYQYLLFVFANQMGTACMFSTL